MKIFLSHTSRDKQTDELTALAPLEGALEGLRTITDLASIHLITTRLPCSRKSTIEWLETREVPEHCLHFVRHGEKHVSLRSFDLAIEDHYEQAVSFTTSGTPTALIQHPWNLGKPKVSGIQWVDGWGELVARIGDIIRTTD